MGRALGGTARDLADRRVGHLPVDGEAEPPPQLLELLLVLDHEAVAQLDEPLTRDRDLAVALDSNGDEIDVSIPNADGTSEEPTSEDPAPDTTPAEESEA